MRKMKRKLVGLKMNMVMRIRGTKVNGREKVSQVTP